MEFDRPDDDAYSRVTNPERYQPVVDAARALVDQLEAVHDVTRTTGVAATHFAKYSDPEWETIGLEPAQGVPLAFMITDFPGVMVRFGDIGYRAGFPECGCDACDELPEEEITELHRLVDAATAGRYLELLTKRVMRSSYLGPWGSRSQSQSLRRGEWRKLGDLGERRWPRWPRRAGQA